MNARRPRVLFVTRRFPPTVGGQEHYAADIHRVLAASSDVTLVALHRRHLAHLVWFLPWAAARIVVACALGRTERIVFGDAVVYSVLGWFVCRRGVERDVFTLGLDVAFPNRIYRALLRRGLRRADRIVALSRAGIDPLERLGVAAPRVAIVAPGIDPPTAEVDRATAREELRSLLGVAAEAFVVLLVGRLVQRKGTEWFVDAVCPQLPEEVVCIVAGDGPRESAVRAVVDRRALRSRVLVLGSVTDELRDTLYAASDVVAMPNVPVNGDMEGFGIVAVEAMLAGAVVVAADLEGLQDSVLDGVTGYTCPPRCAPCFVARVTELMSDPDRRSADADRFRSAARARFSFERMASDVARALDAHPRSHR